MTRALEAIVFDFDGVIVDTERLHLRAYQDVLGRMGLELADEAYYQEYLGYDDTHVFRHYARNHGLSWNDEAIAGLNSAKMSRFEELSNDSAMFFPGAAEFIRAAAAALPIAIASGALTHEIEELLERADLRRLFATIVGADQCVRTKPSPDPYLEAFHRLTAVAPGIAKSRTVAIEDSRWGLVSAATAGLRSVAVTNTYTAAELAIHAELVVSGLDALTLEALAALCEQPPRMAAAPDLER